MRILCLESHPMWVHGLPNGFCDAGHEVMVSGPIYEDSIKEMINNFKPDLIFSMGHTPEHTVDKQKIIRKCVKPTGIPLIYWATEDPGYTFTFSLPLIETIQPDFVFTICQSRVNFYKQKGIPAAHLDFGYHSSVHFPSEIDSKYKVSIAVVANGYPMLYERKPKHFRFKAFNTLLSPFIESDQRIDFWGRYWDKMDHIVGKTIPDDCIHGYLPYTEANKVYSSAEIILGVQNHDTQVTQRTYEILGSGGFLLTNDTSEIRHLFEPDKDLVVSNSPEETVEKVDYYLNHPEERKQIQKNGMEKVRNYSYKERAKYVLKTICKNGIICERLMEPGHGSIIYYIDKLKEQYELYEVQSDDTLWRISRKVGVSIEQLRKLNHLNNDLIIVNQYLRIRER